MVDCIFIVGNSRSGTTMLGRILGLHAKVHTFEELHFFDHKIFSALSSSWGLRKEEKKIIQLERLLTSSRKGFFQKVVPGEFVTDARAILDSYDGEDSVALYAGFLKYELASSGKELSCEHTPGYLYYLQDILKAFPESRIINVVRDPRDVLLSQKNKWKRKLLGGQNIPLMESIRSWSNYHPFTISKLWVSAVREAEKFKSHPRFLSIRFEDLLDYPDKTVSDLCRFSGISYEDGMLEIPQVGSSSSADVPDSTGINKKRRGAWLQGGLTPYELDICQRVTGNLMSQWGYSPVFSSSSVLQRCVGYFSFLIKGVGAVMLNFGRTKNIIATIRKRMFSK